MWRKFLFLLALLVGLFVSHGKVFAQTSYTITSFDSRIILQQDTSLLVQETIRVNFTYPRHGIFRTIPVIYSAKGRTIKTNLSVYSVVSDTGKAYQYEISRLSQGMEIKIGDPDVSIVGPQVYIITYKVDKVLQRFEEYEEIYWNVTGSEWDAEIKSASATVESTHASIEKVACYAGFVEDVETNCEVRYWDKDATFNSTITLGAKKDFTIVVGLSKNNSLIFPTEAEVALQIISDNWGYLPVIAPFLFMFGFWFFRGRDKKYLEGNIYDTKLRLQHRVLQVEDLSERRVKSVGIFERHYLPLVYSPIIGLTPAQIGAIIDEKVDIQDVVSEILELARLGYIKIEKIEGKKKDYSLTKLASDEKGVLRSYQRYLLQELFSHGIKDRSFTTLSDLKNKFYTSLEGFKSRLYDDLKILGYFYMRPDHARNIWLGVGFGLLGVFGALTFTFSASSHNFYPVGLFIILIFPTLLATRYMPKKTPEGYNLLWQIRGLHYYVGKGEWRLKIAEKHLYGGGGERREAQGFIEEILPIAVALGVVKKLAKDMEELKIGPPAYFGGTTGHGFYNDFHGFYKTGSSSLTSVPASSREASSWSGGSWFSGGFSGGGFGGGGGGSW